MTTIATLNNVMEAELLRMRLGAFGIQAFVQDENMLNSGVTLLEVRVQVADEDVPAVRKYLAEDVGV